MDFLTRELLKKERQLKEQSSRMKRLDDENAQLKESWAYQRDKMERLEGYGAFWLRLRSFFWYLVAIVRSMEIF